MKDSWINSRCVLASVVAERASITTPGYRRINAEALSFFYKTCTTKKQDWNHLFTTTSLEMKNPMGLTIKQRKYVFRFSPPEMLFFLGFPALR